MLMQGLSRFRAVSFLFLLSCFLVNSFFSIVPDMLIIVVAVLAFTASLPDMTLGPRWVILLIVSFSQIMFFHVGGDVETWKNIMTESLVYICLFVTAPLLSMPIRAGGYVALIEQLSDRYKDKQILSYTAIAVISSVLGVFMTVGAMYVVSELFEKKLRENKRLTAETILQGSAVPLLLSPYVSGVAIILNILGLTLFPFFFWGLIAALIGIGIIALRLVLRIRWMGKTGKAESSATAEGEEALRFAAAKKPVNRKLGIQLLLGFASIFLGVVILEQILQSSFIIIVSILALTIPVLWLLMAGKNKELKKELITYKNVTLPGVHNHMFLIISAILFSKTLQLTAVPDYLSGMFAVLTDFSLFFAILILMLIILIPSLIGVHSMIPMLVIATTVSPETLGLDPSLFAVVLTVGYALASQVSPLSILSLVAGRLLKVQPYQFIVWNWQFVLLFIFSAVCFIYGVNAVLP